MCENENIETILVDPNKPIPFERFIAGGGLWEQIATILENGEVVRFYDADDYLRVLRISDDLYHFGTERNILRTLFLEKFDKFQSFGARKEVVRLNPYVIVGELKRITPAVTNGLSSITPFSNGEMLKSNLDNGNPLANWIVSDVIPGEAFFHLNDAFIVELIVNAPLTITLPSIYRLKIIYHALDDANDSSVPGIEVCLERMSKRLNRFIVIKRNYFDSSTDDLPGSIYEIKTTVSKMLSHHDFVDGGYTPTNLLKNLQAY